MGLTLDTTVVVKELTDSGNATKSGVKLGDQLQQVCVCTSNGVASYIYIHLYVYMSFIQKFHCT